MSRHCRAACAPQQRWEATGQRDHHAQHVLGHVRRRHAAGVGQHHPARGDLGQIVALDPGARRRASSAAAARPASIPGSSRQPITPSASRSSSSVGVALLRSSPARRRRHPRPGRRTGSPGNSARNRVRTAAGTSIAMRTDRSGGATGEVDVLMAPYIPLSVTRRNISHDSRVAKIGTRDRPRDGGAMPIVVYTASRNPAASWRRHARR